MNASAPWTMIQTFWWCYGCCICFLSMAHDAMLFFVSLSPIKMLLKQSKKTMLCVIFEFVLVLALEFGGEPVQSSAQVITTNSQVFACVTSGALILKDQDPYGLITSDCVPVLAGRAIFHRLKDMSDTMVRPQWLLKLDPPLNIAHP